MLTLLFDVLLGVGMLVAAFGALWSRDLFRAVVLFIVFGLLVALAWIRLQAPDVALAEAAIGAGLTGALLLDALGHLRSGGREAASTEGKTRDATPQNATPHDATPHDATRHRPDARK